MRGVGEMGGGGGVGGGCVGGEGGGREEGGCTGEQRGEVVGHGQVLHRAGLQNLRKGGGQGQLSPDLLHSHWSSITQITHPAAR